MRTSASELTRQLQPYGVRQVFGIPGACFIISGPGMSNIMTAIGQAYLKSIPMLVISAVNSHGCIGSGDDWLHGQHSICVVPSGH